MAERRYPRRLFLGLATWRCWQRLVEVRAKSSESRVRSGESEWFAHKKSVVTHGVVVQDAEHLVAVFFVERTSLEVIRAQRATDATETLGLGFRLQ